MENKIGMVELVESSELGEVTQLTDPSHYSDEQLRETVAMLEEKLAGEKDPVRMKEQKDKSINIPISFEHLLSSLFGKKSYHCFVGIHKFSVWKTNVLKIFRAIEKSFLVNIRVIDESHKKNLLKLFDDGILAISQAKNKDDLNVLTIEYMTNIIFTLEGGIPDNWQRKTVNRDEYWELNRYRQIVYTQNQKQKVNLLLSLPNKYPQYSNCFADKRELISKYGELKHDDSEFINWFKGQYADIYLELF